MIDIHLANRFAYYMLWFNNLSFFLLLVFRLFVTLRFQIWLYILWFYKSLVNFIPNSLLQNLLFQNYSLFSKLYFYFYVIRDYKARKLVTTKLSCILKRILLTILMSTIYFLFSEIHPFNLTITSNLSK